MSTLSLRLPDSLHKMLKQVAKEDGVSINQFVSLAVAEKLSALSTENYIKERAERADRAAFLEVLDKVPDVPPVAGDELPGTEKHH